MCGKPGSGRVGIEAELGRLGKQLRIGMWIEIT
jgi:hypothetical protein